MKKLDLRKDFADLSSLVVQRVKAFDPAKNPGPGKGKKVSRIDVGYGVFEQGWVCLVFDTRPKAEPDGEWNEFIEDTVLERPRWAKACDTLENEPMQLIMPDGTAREIEAGDTDALVTAIGEMLREVLLEARNTGAFASLPLSTKCELGVEEQDGAYGWPDSEARGTDNRATT